MDMVSRPFGQPEFNLFMFVSAVVINDDVEVEVGGHVGVEVAQEL